jgi:murein L,D-transpeptidase YcbB/YkuD
MGGRPPVAGLRAVAVAMTLLAGLLPSAVFAEQIPAPVLDQASRPSAVKKKLKRVFRPTMPERNPIRATASAQDGAPEADTDGTPQSASVTAMLAASVGQGAESAASVAAASAGADTLPMDAESPPTQSAEMPAESAAVTSDIDTSPTPTGSIDPKPAETAVEPSSDTAEAPAAVTEVSLLDEATPASPTPAEATPSDAPPAIAEEAPDAAEQPTAVTEVSAPSDPAPTPSETEQPAEPVKTAEKPSSDEGEQPTAAIEHDATVVLEVSPPDETKLASVAPAEVERPTVTAEEPSNNAEEELPAAQDASPPDEAAPAPVTPAEAEPTEPAEETESAEMPPSGEADPPAAATEASSPTEPEPAEEAESAGTPPSSETDQPAAATEVSPPAGAEPAPGEAEEPPAVVEVAPPPAHPIVAAVRTKLAEPDLRKGAAAADLEALEAFYGEQQGPPLWVTDTGFSAKAQAIIEEIGKADDWGLEAASFDLPTASDQPTTPDAQATGEIKMSIAILSYARDAQIGRLTPSRVSNLFDQNPSLRDPKTVLTETAAADDPSAYLVALHPQYDQFKRLREALLKARDANNTREIQRLVINMERWRWMPRQLGAYHVWNNVPEFNVRVVKNGKTIYEEKTIVGQFKYATPFFSATMRTIVFHPDWTVPPTILKEDLAPKLQSERGFFGNANTAILRQHDLRVSFKGQPVDADAIDWRSANIHQYTFTQAPGPANVLGQLKFNFPNRHAIYMHDTPQRELFAETVRTLSHGCIRVREPERLAALLLAQDKGWAAGQVRSLLARNTSDVIRLSRTVPVHLTYFTAVVDETGRLDTFGDIYGLDNRMAAKLFKAPVKFPVPATPVTAEASPRPSDQRRSSGGGLDELISGLFGN